MAIEGLTLIGETINDSVPSTKALFEARDIEGILELARFQDERGADYIDVNVGSRSPEFMADMVAKVQQVTAKPLSIDTPDPAIAKAGLEAYDLDRTGGAEPILNSISALRVEMFDLYSICPFRPILLVTERLVGENSQACHTAEDTYTAAQELVAIARKADPGLTNNNLIIDPGIAPIAGDTDGNLKRLLGAMQKIHEDPDLAGCHMSVGLSNFTVMLPSKRKDGSPVKSPLESAFLTLAMPLGLDTIIGSVKRKYARLEDGHPALECVREFLAADGIEGIMRLRQFYTE